MPLTEGFNINGLKYTHGWHIPRFSMERFVSTVFFLEEKVFTMLDHLYKSPLRNWQVALKRCHNHANKSQLHHTATIRASQFRSFMEQKQIPIDQQLSQAMSEQVKKNRDKLIPIIEAIILCERQNIPLRGHRDDSKHWNDDSVNAGNLQEIKKYLVRCGQNKAMEEHFKTAPKNTTYRSKTTQNEIISICGEIITEKIVGEVKKAKFFSILPDEAADISNIEQMPVIVRFVDNNSVIREEFLAFVPCELGLSGEAIATTLVDTMNKAGLDMGLCRGQGYDGAGNMAGRCSEATVRIQRQYPKAT